MTTARWILTAFGVLVACIGVTVVAWPTRLLDFADLWVTTRGLWIAAALRLLVGVLMWIVAGASRTPKTFRVLGALFVVTGVLLPILGLDYLRGIVEWGSSRSDGVLRGMGLLATVLGAFIAWSAAPRRRAS